MQLTQSFTVLYGTVAVALSLITGTHALPTVSSTSGLSLAREVGQNGTHHDVPVIDIARRATPAPGTQPPPPPPPPINVPIQSIQASGQDVGFVTSIRMGSQGQVVPVRVDTGSTTLWVVSGTSQQRGRRQGFQQAASQTFQPVQQQWGIQYGDQSTAGGPTVARDSVRIGSLTVPGFPVGLGETLTGNLINDPDSGILGLGNGRLGGTRTGGPTLLDGLAGAGLIPASVVGIKLGRGTPGRPSVGRLTLGGQDPTLFNNQPGNIVTVANANNAGLWQVRLTDVRVGGTAVARTGIALLDTGAARITASADDVATLHSIIFGAVQHDGIFALPCNTANIITFTINRVAFPMAAGDIVGPPIGPTVPGMCISNIQPSTRLQRGQWSLGIPFLKNVYQILDSGTNQITLARLT